MSSENNVSKQESFLPTAGTVSVTVIHDPSKSYGLRLSQHRRSDIKDINRGNRCFDSRYGNESDDIDVVIDMIANTHSNGMLKGSPLKEGDILRTINNRKAIDFLGSGDSNNAEGFCSYIKGGSFQEGQAVTLVADRPLVTGNDDGESDRGSSDNDTQGDLAVVQAFCRKSKSSNTNSNSSNNNSSDTKNSREKAISVGVEFRRVVIRDEEDDESIQKKENCTSDMDASDSEDNSSHCSSTSSQSSYSSSFLQINRIDPNGLFAHSVLNQGDIVLAINGYSVCADENLTVEEANELLGIHADSETPPASPSDRAPNFGVSVYEMVDILALNPRKLLELRRHQYDSSRPTLWGRGKSEQIQWMKKKVKKAGVAIGGGSLIGAGIVIHPFGPLLMVSGVSFLGTEFELPRKIARNTRDSFKNWAEAEELAPDHPDVSPYPDANVLSTEREDNDSSRNSDQSCQVETRTSNNTTESRPPLPTMKNRMKGLGRRYVLPFLNKMVGDRRDTRIEPTSSFDIHDNNMDNHDNRDANTNQYQNELILKQQELQSQDEELQGRDDVFSEIYYSSLEHDRTTNMTLERIP